MLAVRCMIPLRIHRYMWLQLSSFATPRTLLRHEPLILSGQPMQEIILVVKVGISMIRCNLLTEIGRESPLTFIRSINMAGFFGGPGFARHGTGSSSIRSQSFRRRRKVWNYGSPVLYRSRYDSANLGRWRA